MYTHCAPMCAAVCGVAHTVSLRYLYNFVMWPSLSWNKKHLKMREKKERLQNNFHCSTLLAKTVRQRCQRQCANTRSVLFRCILMLFSFHHRILCLIFFLFHSAALYGVHDIDHFIVYTQLTHLFAQEISKTNKTNIVAILSQYNPNTNVHDSINDISPLKSQTMCWKCVLVWLTFNPSDFCLVLFSPSCQNSIFLGLSFGLHVYVNQSKCGLIEAPFLKLIYFHELTIESLMLQCIWPITINYDHQVVLSRQSPIRYCLLFQLSIEFICWLIWNVFYLF